MSELLRAAKSVIKRFSDWDCVHIDNLRAAVERAEKSPTDFDEWWGQTEIWPSEYTAAASAWTAAQQAERERIRARVISDFDEWWDTAGTGTFDDAQYTWTAAQQAERERIKDIIKTVGVQCDNGTWVKCETIMEKIDAPDA